MSPTIIRKSGDPQAYAEYIPKRVFMGFSPVSLNLAVAILKDRQISYDMTFIQKKDAKKPKALNIPFAVQSDSLFRKKEIKVQMYAVCRAIQSENRQYPGKFLSFLKTRNINL
ncbi:hypothetical protein TNIN_76681 [Trichonephila inaurata madagascariensis]|uniref:Uncharacterized protein n=1 Tax=Trichonephila inaurata madagascariensis TaxID=2747483 RepID=A0A8X6Y4K1_9ARAC|nr:hypothetical protein TNIN_76681 [Trichonephila inaurata madagascariensis]